MHLIATPDDGTLSLYDRVWISPGGESFTFTVKACNDAHLVMTSIPGDYQTDVYEVVIGGSENTNTYIRRGYIVSADFMSIPTGHTALSRR